MNYPRMTMNIPVLLLNKNHQNPSADVLSLRAAASPNFDKEKEMKICLSCRIVVSLRREERFSL